MAFGPSRLLWPSPELVVGIAVPGGARLSRKVLDRMQASVSTTNAANQVGKEVAKSENLEEQLREEYHR